MDGIRDEMISIWDKAGKATHPILGAFDGEDGGDR
jgi:hypothetical protein